MIQHDILLDLLKRRCIGNKHDMRAAYSLVGFWKARSRWTWKQQKLANQLIERWTEPSNVARWEREQQKARAHAVG